MLEAIQFVVVVLLAGWFISYILQNKKLSDRVDKLEVETVKLTNRDIGEIRGRLVEIGARLVKLEKPEKPEKSEKRRTPRKKIIP